MLYLFILYFLCKLLTLYSADAEQFLYHGGSKNNDKPTWYEFDNHWRWERSVSDAVTSTQYFIFQWDKEKLSAFEYHLNVCTDRCFNGQLVQLNSTLGCPNIACFSCDCSMPQCRLYDTCCPDLLEVTKIFPSQIRLLEHNNIGLDFSDPLLQDVVDIFPDSARNISNCSDHNVSASIESNGTKEAEWWSRQGPNLVCRKERVGPSFLHIRSCPEDHGNETEETGCETDVDAESQSILFYQYVTDMATGISYFNALCAACNQVAAEKVDLQMRYISPQIAPWSVEIECNHLMYVYTALDDDSFLKLSLQPRSTCNVYQVPPKTLESEMMHNTSDDRGSRGGSSSASSSSSIGISSSSIGISSSSSSSSTTCLPSWFGALYSSCNITGLWRQWDADIESACLNMDHPTLRLFDFRQNRGVIFKNIFCAICNTGQYPWFYDSCKDQFDDGPVPVTSLPFSLLLGTRSRSPVKKIVYSPFANCPASHWAGPDGQCYPLECTSGKVLDQENNSCITALPSIGGLGYKVQLYYTVKPKTKLSTNSSFVSAASSDKDIIDLYLDSFKGNIRDLMYSLSASGELFFNVIAKRKRINDINDLYSTEREADSSFSSNKSILYPSMFAMTSRFTDTSDLGRDGFERSVLHQLVNADLELSITDDHTLVLTPVTVLDGYDQFMECSSVRHVSETHQCSSGRLIRLAFGIDPDSIWAATDIFLPFISLLTCPYVGFTSAQYQITADMSQVPPSFNITLNFTDIEFYFSFPFEMNMLALGSESLIVCYDVLQSKASEIGPLYYLVAEEEDEEILLSQYILTMICQILSILCLICTLATYFIFASLRSAAGMNNIFLCLSLLFAQAFLLAASHVTSSGPFCTILAIATHFLWLCMFCWSFVCCFHMYRIFTAKTRSANVSAKSRKIELVRKAVLCALAPALVVISVVITNKLSHGTSGYGEDGCFLDSSLLIWLTVIAPLVLVLICNLFFFGSTVMKIHGVRKLQSGENIKKDDRQNLYIYIKLSSMTGGFWVVSILAETLDNEPLRYISIVLNGLQGFFLFMSYIANRRVLNMYLKALGLQEYLPSSSSATDRSTLAKAASGVHKQGKPVESEVSASPVRKSTLTQQTSVESVDSGCRDGEDEPAENEEKTVDAQKMQETLHI
ncbi:adhesion g protein-coupled receptor l3 [Plakobranchus ocellatus]|uniref:Adhesion g protein-coupled receptor l3 n=1 Tax=Plakobranchus ocellatus TaxID=259542 RepID=A0AAV4A6T3_9GAST|nr:adhesion g protein-coupled receptor l3 [Plakobranchus ocellatus]